MALPMSAVQALALVATIRKGGMANALANLLLERDVLRKELESYAGLSRSARARKAARMAVELFSGRAADPWELWMQRRIQAAKEA